MAKAAVDRVQQLLLKMLKKFFCAENIDSDIDGNDDSDDYYNKRWWWIEFSQPSLALRIIVCIVIVVCERGGRNGLRPTSRGKSKQKAVYVFRTMEHDMMAMIVIVRTCEKDILQNRMTFC